MLRFQSSGFNSVDHTIQVADPSTARRLTHRHTSRLKSKSRANRRRHALAPRPETYAGFGGGTAAGAGAATGAFAAALAALASFRTNSSAANMVVALMDATRFLKTEKRKIAGTESATPMNVTTRASEIASATSLALMPASDRAMTMKLAIIPFRVPSKPIIGPRDPRTANMLIFFSNSTTCTSAVRSIASRASAKPADSSPNPAEAYRLNRQSFSLIPW